MKIEKMYNVFNLVVATEEQARTIVEGWEHKESINEVYVIVEGNKQSEYNLDLEQGMLLFKTYEQAQEELNEML